MRPLHVSAVLLFIGAILLVAGVTSNSWLVSERGEWSARMGLREFELCMDRYDCRTTSFEEYAGSLRVSEIPTRAKVMIWSGKFSFGIGLAAALCAVISAVILLSLKTRHGVIVALGVGSAAIIAAVVFLVSVDAELSNSLGWSLFAYYGGAAAIVTASVLALSKVPTKAAIPVTPQLGLAVPACVQCNAPTTLVSEYNRYFCQRCRMYV